MDDSNAEFDDLYGQGDTRHSELNNKFNSPSRETKKLIEELGPRLERDTALWVTTIEKLLVQNLD